MNKSVSHYKDIYAKLVKEHWLENKFQIELSRTRPRNYVMFSLDALYLLAYYLDIGYSELKEPTLFCYNILERTTDIAHNEIVRYKRPFVLLSKLEPPSNFLDREPNFNLDIL